jgi:hypothetical protein
VKNMTEKLLKLSIKPKEELSGQAPLRSNGYEVKIGDWVLGKGVTTFNIVMDANKKPVVTITCQPDEMDVELIDVIAKTDSLNAD